MRRFAALLLLAAATGCATSKPQVDMSEPRRVVGTENLVRVDAQVFGDRIAVGTPITIKYDITNQRAEPILVADLIPATNYDPETGMVTIDIGTEIPGAEFLPRLIAINSGEKKSFNGKASLNVIISRNRTPNMIVPQAPLRIRINFLGETKPFEQLIGIPEKAVHDPKLADDLFTKWVEGNETVVTNAVPMRWATGQSEEPPLDARVETASRNPSEPALIR